MSDELDTREIADAGALAELERDVAREATRSRLFGAPAAERKVSRFTLLERVGSGGMGTVYAAYDPELDRRVAVKLLDARSSNEVDTDTNARRLLAEARAMAKLSHPNVVTVYEVGVHAQGEGQPPVVFVAMQFVAGLTLRQWVERRAPDWRRIVAAYLAAGRGLAAVHAASLVHRDFKPDNAMITDEHERVVVMDFGLARQGSEREVAIDRTGNDDAAVDELTHDAGLGGTPGYMAPELFAGRPATERSDQFAFCVALFEALWGERPFAGAHLSELVRNLDEGRVLQPGDLRGVPSSIRRAVLRGLEAKPERRFADMHALLDVLERAVSPRHRVRNTALVLAPAMVVLAWANTRASEPACDPEQAIAQVWNDDARAAVHTALTQEHIDGAEDLEARVVARIDAWTQQWSQTFEQACELRAEWSSSLSDRAGSCLEGRMTRLQAALAAISRVDLTRRSKAIDLANDLPPAQPCIDRARLLAEVAPPDDAATEDEVAAIRGELADVAARVHVGELDGLRELSDGVRARAESTRYAPVIAEARTEAGIAAHVLGDDQAAIALLEDGFFTAVAAGHTVAAIDAATPLTTIAGGATEGIERGRLWLRHARALLAAYPEDHERRGHLDLDEAELLRVANDLPGARARVMDAIATFEQLGRDDTTCDAYSTLGFIELRAGDFTAAARAFETARDLADEAYGRQHPHTGDILIGMATVAHRQRDLERAGELLAEATAVYEAALGPEHPNVLGSLHNRGSLEQARGNHVGARALLEDVLARRERVLGSDHPDLAGTLGLLSTVYEDLGELDRAEAVNGRALAIARKTFGESHTMVADLLHNRGSIAIDRGDFTGAIAATEQAQAIRTALLGPDHPEIALGDRNLSRAYRGLGDLERAESFAREAVRIQALTLRDDDARLVTSRAKLAEIQRERASASRVRTP